MKDREAPTCELSQVLLTEAHIEDVDIDFVYIKLQRILIYKSAQSPTAPSKIFGGLHVRWFKRERGDPHMEALYPIF
jgi:hypothetical protein